MEKNIGNKSDKPQPIQQNNSVQEEVVYDPIPQTQPIVSNPSVSKPTAKYVHPFIELVNRNAPTNELINTMALYLDISTGEDSQSGEKYYLMVDQSEFIAPVLQVFSFSATNGREPVVRWIMENFVMLDVSYDNNFCYFDSIRWKHEKIADLITTHESFNPTPTVLQNLLARQKYDIFKKCMQSPAIQGLVRDYRFTFIKYLNENKYSAVHGLVDFIIKKEKVPNTIIPDEILLEDFNSGNISNEIATVVIDDEKSVIVEPDNLAQVPTNPSINQVNNEPTSELRHRKTWANIAGGS